MEYVIGVILIIIVIIIALLLFRKRLYDQIDYYENWKIDIMGRNVAQELTRVKSLNTEGEAKEQLDHWREEWDTILMKDLADVEEVLFDAEQAADRFRISNARRHVTQLEEMLVKIEKKIERILSEAERLLETEKENRQAMEQLKPRVKKLRKRLSQNRYEYDRAAVRLDDRLDDVEEDIRIYNELVQSGTYSEASNIVKRVREKITSIERAMDDFPDLYKKSKYDLPNQLDDLYKNVQEMEASGYNLEHLQISKTLNEYQTRLLDFVIALEKMETDKIKKLIPEIEEQIEDLYKQLENEVIAKSFVDSKSQSFSQSLSRLLNEFTNTKEEVEELKKTYHFEDEDLEKYMSLEKRIALLHEKYEKFTIKLTKNNDAQSELRSELSANIDELEKITAEHEQYKKQIDNLRKDEIEAREQIEWMTDELNKTKRKLRQSNLPGIPNFILSMLEEATEKNERVLDVLKQQPLDIIQVQKSLKDAKSTVENALDKTNRMIEQARLTELVIQYANRYRSKDPILAAKLLEAEQLFRQAEYELALEQAAKAVEEVEPGALKRVEEIHSTVIVIA